MRHFCGIHRGREREAMGRSGPRGSGRHVAETQLVIWSTPSRRPSFKCCLGFLGADDPHPLRREMVSPTLTPVVPFRQCVLLARVAPAVELDGPSGQTGSDGQQLALFTLQHPINVCDVLLGQPVELLLRSFEVVS
jgi:hypothetical protein